MTAPVRTHASLMIALSLALPVLLSLTGCAAPTAPSNPWSRFENLPQGEDFFPIGVWAQNPARAGQYKELGVDYYFGLHGGPTEADMVQLRKYNMPAIANFNDYARKNLLNEPLIWGWMHGDEPDLAHVYPRDLLKSPEGKKILKEKWPEVYAELDLDNNEYNGWGMGAHPVLDIQAGYKDIKAVDPVRPVFLQLSKAVALDGSINGRGDHKGRVDLYPGYIAGGDIISYDIYPVAYGNPDKLWRVAKGLDQLVAWGAVDKPRMIILEAGFGETWANPAQQRAEVWMSVNHGATSITWFCHRWAKVDGQQKMTSSQMPLDNPEVGASVKALNAELHALAPVINSPALTSAVTAAGGEMDLGARAYGGAIYIFAVERGNVGGKITFTVPDAGNATVEVINEDRSLPCKGGTFTDAFDAFGTHLYKIVLK